MDETRKSGSALDPDERRTQAKLDQLAGAAQDLRGQASEVANRATALAEDWLRTTIETQPYTAVAIALGLGWLLGRMHRPL